MATRARTGGSNTIQYEDFKPKSEMKEEAAAHVLLVHLPAGEFNISLLKNFPLFHQTR